MLRLAARGAGRQLGREPGRQQQLGPEGERLGAGGGLRLRVEQAQLVAEQVVGGRVGLGRVEQPQHRLARLGGALERGAPLAQRRVGVHGVGLVIVQSSPRPSWSTRFTRLSGSSRPPRRERTRRTPFAIAPTRPRSAV